MWLAIDRQLVTAGQNVNSLPVRMMVLRCLRAGGDFLVGHGHSIAVNQTRSVAGKDLFGLDLVELYVRHSCYSCGGLPNPVLICESLVLLGARVVSSSQFGTAHANCQDRRP